MQKHLKNIGSILFMASFYFAAAYFATAAMLPSLAIHIAFAVMVLAILAYLVLVFTDRAEPGMALTLLMLLPTSCVAAGIIWWIMRLFGFPNFQEK